MLPVGAKIVRIYLKSGLDNLPTWAPQLLAVASKSYPTLTWSSPIGIKDGDLLSENQLNATADVPGTFHYTPALNTLLKTGIHELKVDFIPTDLTKFLPVSKVVQLPVGETTAIEGTSIESINIYPNPFVNSIHLSASESVSKVSVYNMLGVLVYTSTPNKNNFELDLSRLNSGVYQIDLQVNTSTKSYKLIKK